MARHPMVWPALLVLLAVAACGDGPVDGPARGGERGTAAADAGRLDEAARRAMVEVLRTALATDRRLWLVVAPGRQEASTLAADLEAVFEDAGWTPLRQPLRGMTLKPGPIRILVGDEEEPPSVDAIRRALAAGGLETQTGRGYRAFYEERKRENPAWVGVPMAPDQPFLVVIAGPPPPDS